MMYARHGKAFLAALAAPPQAGGVSAGGLATRLMELAPATLTLALYARPGPSAAAWWPSGTPLTAGGALCLVWLPWPSWRRRPLPQGPRPALNLFLLVPLNLLAAQAMVDLADRRISTRALTWLAPVTALGVVWCRARTCARPCTSWRGANCRLRLGPGPAPGSGCSGGPGRTDARGQPLGPAPRRPQAGDLLGPSSVGPGGGGCLGNPRGPLPPPRDHRPALAPRGDPPPPGEPAVHRAGRRRARIGTLPAGGVGVQPGGRLRFLLRATLPDLAQLDLARPEDLLKLPGGRRLVIVVGPGAGRRLSYPTQARLGLESIHPFGRQGCSTPSPRPRSRRPTDGQAVTGTGNGRKVWDHSTVRRRQHHKPSPLGEGGRFSGR